MLNIERKHNTRWSLHHSSSCFSFSSTEKDIGNRLKNELLSAVSRWFRRLTTNGYKNNNSVI